VGATLSRIAKYLTATIAVIIGFVFFWYLIPRSSSFGMFAGPNEANLGRLVLTFATTIAGVVLGSFYRNLRAYQATGIKTIENPSVFIGEMFRSVDMWLGLVGAPIVCALLLQSSSGMNLPGILVLALENGFCCVVLVNSFVSGVEADPRIAGRTQGSPQTPHKVSSE
jgi:membrane protease YdiL (CAAX protease family)